MLGAKLLIFFKIVIKISNSIVFFLLYKVWFTKIHIFYKLELINSDFLQYSHLFYHNSPLKTQQYAYTCQRLTKTLVSRVCSLMLDYAVVQIMRISFIGNRYIKTYRNNFTVFKQRGLF